MTIFEISLIWFLACLTFYCGMYMGKRSKPVQLDIPAVVTVKEPPKTLVVETPQTPIFEPRTPEPRSASLVAHLNDCFSLDKRLVEVLIHNVSHGDLILEIQPQPKDDSDTGPILCRPSFNHYLPICTMIYENLKSRSDLKIKYSAVIAGSDAKEEEGLTYPIGFDLSGDPITMDSVSHLRFRGNDVNRISVHYPILIIGICYPLLALLIPKWCPTIFAPNRTHPSVINVESVDALSSLLTLSSCLRVIIIISGVGIPRNKHDPICNNSTQASCSIISLLLSSSSIDRCYTFASLSHVLNLHVNRDLFHYNDNLIFARTILKPLFIQASQTLVELNPSIDWRQTLKTTISIADGSIARLSVLISSLREFKPQFIHFWQLKSYWTNHHHLDVNDVHMYSNEEFETRPAVLSSSCDGQVAMMVSEMKQFKRDFEACVYNNGNAGGSEMMTFWLRKTHKPVLALLLIKSSSSSSSIGSFKSIGNDFRLYRGTNMEVSMPTGSLCAERNVIGSALADVLGLARRDFVAIAVLSLSSASSGRSTLVRQRSIRMYPQADDGGGASSPIRPSTAGQSEKLTELMTDHDEQDKNPIQPCGACNEWLKKIAEVNPQFTVVTFTDSDCKGVYVDPVSSL